jgi:hypothetical protein
MTKRERQAAARLAAEQARIAAFLDKGNPEAQERPTPAAAPVEPAPAESSVEPTAPQGEAEAPASGEQDAVEAASESAEGTDDAETPATATQAASEPKKGRAKPATPWANAHPRVTVNFSTKFNEELHMQMTWLTENVPKLSIQKIVQEATAQYVAKKIKEHYKP